jgi:hypothetical protein
MINIVSGKHLKTSGIKSEAKPTFYTPTPDHHLDTTVPELAVVL